MIHFLTLVAALCSIAAGDERKPKIILFVADDLGFETLGSYGGTSYATPHIDRLAAAGMRFDSCVATPMCATSRAMLLSGKHNFRNYNQWAHLDAAETTIASHLRKAGYSTGMAGKWHLGNWEPDGDGNRGPARFGFDRYLSCIVDELGLAENTLFLLTSDNGTDNVREAAALRSDWRGKSVRGGKYHPNELGTTVPLFACWPGRVAAASSTRVPVDFTDFLPTLMEIAGLSVPVAADGQSMLPILLGKPGVRRAKPAFSWGTLDGSNRVYHDPLAHRETILHAVRDERWRYLSDGRIFDIAADPLMGKPFKPGMSPEADAARSRMKNSLDQLRSSEPRLW